MGSYSTTTRAEVGGNNGNKISVNQKIYINNSKGILKNKKINFLNSKIQFIRILKGTNFDYFTEKSIKNFFSEDFTVTKLTDRMGMRLKGPILDNNKEVLKSLILKNL